MMKGVLYACEDRTLSPQELYDGHFCQCHYGRMPLPQVESLCDSYSKHSANATIRLSTLGLK